MGRRVLWAVKLGHSLCAFEINKTLQLKNCWAVEFVGPCPMRVRNTAAKKFLLEGMIGLANQSAELGVARIGEVSF